MIRVGVVGSAGYTGGEILRLLLFHPKTKIIFAHSSSQSGKFVSDIHRDLIGDTDLKFSKTLNLNVDVVFLCLSHGESRKFLTEHKIPTKIKIIDLSEDFRLNKNSSIGKRNFIYGLPELQKDKIKNSNSIANPGCFATSIQLALLPLAKENLLSNEISINGITGSTGAGQSLSETSHFSWRVNNLAVYKPFEHQHINEVGETLSSLQSSLPFNLNFVPMRGGFSRGIITTSQIKISKNISEIELLYKKIYASSPFVFISSSAIDLKQVINTNKCLIKLTKNKNQLLVECIIDNLLKGASGQALQNMNLMFGFDETDGLKLKPVAF